MSDIDVYCFFRWDHSAEQNVRAWGFLKSEYCTEGRPRIEALKIVAASLQRRAERLAVFRIQSAGLRAEAARFQDEALRLEAQQSDA